AAAGDKRRAGHPRFLRLALAIERDQRQPGIRVVALAQVHRRFSKDYLKRWPHHPLVEMTGKRAAIAPAENGMRMERNLTIRPQRHITDERSYLHLLPHGDRLVRLRFPVEEAQIRLPQRADGLEAGRTKANLTRKGLQAA